MIFPNRKKVILIKLIAANFISVLFFISCSVLANGDSISSFHKTSYHKISSYHQSFKKDYPAKMTVRMLPGSLRGNIERIARMYGGWTVVWKSSEDYNWHGLATVKGASVSDIMGRILIDYPLQANFYQGNHVLVIQPRTLK